MATKEKKAKKGVEAPVEESSEAVPGKEAAAGEESSVAISVLKGDQYVRDYSLELHGDDFQALAEQFVEKMNSKKGSKGDYKIVPSESIPLVEVRYREKADAELHLDKQKPDAPMEDKIRQFDDKSAAIGFAVTKFGSTVLVSKKRHAKK